jgi:cell division septum initiation protein DivIVA
MPTKSSILAIRFLPLAICVSVVPLTLQTAYSGPDQIDPFSSWLQQERLKIEQRLAETRQQEDRVSARLNRAIEIQSKAHSANDMTAKPIADKAVETARKALDNVRAARERDEANLKILDAASKINQECAELRAKALKDRQTLRAQLKASELVSEGSESQAILVVSRTGMATAKLGRLVHQIKGDPISKVLIEAIDNFNFVKAHAPEIGMTIPIRTELIQLQTAWNGINLARTGEECREHIKLINNQSALLQKAVMVGHCSEALHKGIEFVSHNGEQLEKLGKVLGIAVSAADLANELQALHEDFKGFEEQTRSYPEKALAAAKRLDEAQKDTLGRIAACQVRFVNAVTTLP